MKGVVMVGNLPPPVFPTQPAASQLCAMVLKSNEITDGLEQAIHHAWEKHLEWFLKSSIHSSSIFCHFNRIKKLKEECHIRIQNVGIPSSLEELIQDRYTCQG